MLEVLKRWYQTRFSDPDAVTLFLLLVFCFTIIWLFGDLLAPLLVALVMAYLLEWPVARLQKAGLSRTLATSVILILFIAVAVDSAAARRLRRARSRHRRITSCCWAFVIFSQSKRSCRER